jgi:hypothetical protein
MGGAGASNLEIVRIIVSVKSLVYSGASRDTLKMNFKCMYMCAVMQ